MAFSVGTQERKDLDENKLPPRRAAFVAEYLIDLNATQAAIRAGYSPATASEQSAVLLGDVKVKAAIDKAKAQRLSRVNVTQDSVLHQMSLLANSSIDHYTVDDDGQIQLTESAPEGAMAAIQSVKRRKTVKEDREGNITINYDVEIRLWDKPAPLKLMGRHVGLFADRVEHTGPKGGPIELAHLTTEQLLERHRTLIEVTASKIEEPPSQE